MPVAIGVRGAVPWLASLPCRLFELGFTVNVGVSSNKFLAKMGSAHPVCQFHDRIVS